MKDVSESGVSKWARPEPTTENIAFAKRLLQAAENRDGIPRQNGGRFSHVQRLLEAQGVSVSRETVRKRFSGEARPRTEKLSVLARLLSVSEGWLATGDSPVSLPERDRSAAARNEGAVNVVMGAVALTGAQCAAPEPDEAGFHFSAIVGGKLRRFSVARGLAKGDGVRFECPVFGEKVVTIGVVQTGLAAFRLYAFTPRTVTDHGQARGGYFSLKGTFEKDGIRVGDALVRELIDLAELN